MSKILHAVQNWHGAEQAINGVGRDDLPEFFREMGYTVGAEIGVYRGEYTEVLLKGGMKVFGIDPWMDYPDYHTDGMQKNMDTNYDLARERLAPFIESGQCTLIKKTSEEAYTGFEDGSLDFVYIDGHHGFKYVSDDLHYWTKKVKKGGVIAGHDFVFVKVKPHHPYMCHVKQVVRAWTAAYGIEDWFVLGRERGLIEGETRDKWRSWFWINK